jgi:hypothetical protein
MRLIMSFVGSPYVYYDYPKWVTPHSSHVVTYVGGVSVPQFPVNTIVRGTGAVQVLTNNSDEEKKATSQKT